MSKKQVLALTVFTGTFGVLLIVCLLWGVLFGGSGGNIFSSIMPAVIWVLAFLAALATAVAPIATFLYYPADGAAGTTALANPEASPAEQAADEVDEAADDESFEDPLEGEEAVDEGFDEESDEEEVQMFDDGFDDEELDDFEDDEDFR